MILYIILGVFVIFYLWCLKIWWNFNKWIAISGPIIFLLIMLYTILRY